MKTSSLLNSIKYLDSPSSQVFLKTCAMDDLLPLLKFDENIRYCLFAEMSRRAVMMLEEDMAEKDSWRDEDIATAYAKLEKLMLSSLGKTKEQLLEAQSGLINKIKTAKKVRDCRLDYQRWNNKIKIKSQQRSSLVKEGFAALARGNFPITQFHTWSLDPQVQQCINEENLQQIPVISLVWKFLALAKLCHKNGSEALTQIIAQEKNQETKEALQMALENMDCEEIVVSLLVQRHQKIEQHLTKQFGLLRKLVSTLVNRSSQEGIAPQNHQFANLGDFTKQALAQKMEFFGQVAHNDGLLALEQYLYDEACQTIRHAIEMIINGFDEADILTYQQKDEQITLAYTSKKLCIIRDAAFYIAARASRHKLKRLLTCYLDPAERAVVTQSNNL